MSIGRRVAGGVLLAAAAAAFVPRIMWVVHDGWLAVPSLALTAVLAASALLLLRIPAHRPDGWWMVGAVIGMGTSGLSLPELEAGYWVQLAFVTENVTAACLVPPFLRYPVRPAPPRTVLHLTAACWAVLVGLPLLSSAFWVPSMGEYTGPASWLTVYPWEDAANWLGRVVPFVLVIPVSWFTVVQWRRQRTAGGPGGIVVRLLAFLTTAMAWGLVVRVAVVVSGSGELVAAAAFVHLTFAAGALLLVLAVALGITIRRAAFVEDLVAAAGRPPAIEQVLRRYTADPTLRLLFLTHEGWSDAAGRPDPGDAAGDAAAGAGAPPGRRVLPVVVEDGEPVVKVEAAANVDLDDRTTHALIDGAGYVLNSARLSVQQAAQAHELRESRRRIVEASVTQRRLLERDLHDGAQQHLLAAQAALSRAELLDDPAAAGAAIRDARDRLATTLDELRRLARGVHPALLTQAGLGAALASLAELSDRVRVTVSPALDGQRFAPVIEATAWYVASEAVVNALKHHDAPVEVRADVVRADPSAPDAGPGVDTLVCTVGDDGPGGATLVPGGGLVGLRDRVLATGGSFDLTSPPGGGTTVGVRLPLAADREVEP